MAIVEGLAPEFEKHGVQIVAVARDVPAKLQHLAESLGLSFPIVADRNAHVIKAWNIFTYGGVKDWAFFKARIAIPSTFLVDQSGTIIWRYIGARTDRPLPSLLIDILEQNFPLTGKIE